jgi:peroxiredoxin (alkyl hydroperoxide reductase subunit C)
MSVIAPGTPAPEFTLKDEDGEAFTREQLVGQPTILVFYPFAFSSVCTDQLTLYERVRADVEARGARILAVSTDPSHSQRAFKEKLGVSIPQLSDFEPKGAAARAFGAYFEPAGMTNRALVVTDADGVVRWSHLAASPGELPPPELLLEGLDALDAAGD